MVAEELRLYADYRQFYVQDSDPEGSSDDASFWTQEAGDNRLAVTAGMVAVGTGSYGFVRVRVEVHDAKPPVELSAWDHVTEAGLDVRGHFILVLGCLAASGLFFRVRPGPYRVRCCHANLAASVESGEGGDWYFVQIWPGPPAEVRVLKRWSGPA